MGFLDSRLLCATAQNTNARRIGVSYIGIVPYWLVVLTVLVMALIGPTSMHAAMITVTGSPDETLANLNGNGTCDLREALESANTNAAVGECPAGESGLDTIVFDIGTGGSQTISPISGLPTIVEPVEIDGSTQPACSDAPCIVIAGSEAGDSNGLTITAGDSTVRGLVINGFHLNGIFIGEGGNNIVEGSFIGTDATGSKDYGNWYAGVVIENAPNNLIGGSSESERNIISGNEYGVEVRGVGSFGNTIAGNYIGTDANGEVAIDDGSTGGESLVGVFIINASNNTVGGTSNGDGNVISGNGRVGYPAPNGWEGWFGVGVQVTGDQNRLVGNYIGTTKTGNTALGNKRFGVVIEGRENVVGGPEFGAGNVISGNGSRTSFQGEEWDDGVGVLVLGLGDHVIQGNAIGADTSGNLALGNWAHGIEVYSAHDSVIGGLGEGDGNTIAFNGRAGVAIVTDGSESELGPSTGILVVGNSVLMNGELGIDLSHVVEVVEPFVDGVSHNDPLDADTGPNLFQNHPYLDDVALVAGQVRISGALNSLPNTSFALHFYANSEVDLSGYGEGETYLGETSVTTDSSGDVPFSAMIAASPPLGSFITATATDPDGNTSEFSLAIELTRLQATGVPDLDRNGSLLLVLLLATGGAVMLRKL
ncbi:MAG: hypothetical protein GY906_32200 [bacterium]|nr:hypothetical protein [bacterium]